MSDPIDSLRRALAGRYTIARELGRGGMATVYLAQDVKHDRPVALKVLRPEIAAGLGVERFLREVRITARLTHPHILPLLDSGEAAGYLYYVMPFVEGESLRGRLAREKQLPIEDAVLIAREAADALGYAHARGLVHRDIKPENILIDSGHAIVADFGIARALSAAGDDSLTATGIVIGTPAYMSPEQAAGTTDVDGRSDVYALGCVLYEMLAGEAPHAGPTAQAVLTRRLSESAPRVAAIRDMVPDHLNDAVARALARVPADRFATVQAFAAALESRTASHERPAATTTGFPWGPRGLAVAAVAALAVMALAAGLWWRGGADEAPPAPAADAALHSIAVIPFLNMSPDPENEYFADGIAEELLNVLARVDGLRVVPRTSAFAFKGQETPLPDIARQLGVGYVLSGAVRKQGNRARITAQLVEVAGNTHVWGPQTYDRELDDVFAVQEEIAQAIADALAPALGARVSVTAATRDMEAYQLFLRGRARYYDRSLFDRAIVDAVDDLGEATRRDPGFAEAWAYLGAAVFAEAGMRPRWSRAIADAVDLATNHALALDPDLPLARAVRGRRLLRRGHYVEGLRTLQRAAEEESRGTTARSWYGTELLFLGYVDEAIPILEEAHRIDPLVSGNSSYLGVAYLAAGRDAEAETHIRRGIELGSPSGIFSLIAEAANRGDAARAGAFFRESLVVFHRWSTPERRDALVAAFDAAVRDPAAREGFADAAARGFVQQWAWWRVYYLGIRDADRFFEWAYRLYQPEMPARLAWMRKTWLPSLGWLREDPRLLALMREDGITEVWEARGYPMGCRVVPDARGDRLRCPAD
jgi:eukaryotic-like serine/threonine-protein kinase